MSKKPYVKPHKKGGYLIIGGCSVHRAVAELFIPNPENKPCVDHIDTDKHNNILWNLRWVTYKENNSNPLTRKHMSDGQILYEVSKDRIWVNKNNEEKRVKPDKLESFLNSGWHRGRK